MTPTSTRSNQPGRICIVDDTAIHVALLRAILEPRGHMIIPMTSAEEAMPEVLAHPPHVLMVDIKMPGMDGFAFVEELKTRGLSPDTRIMFMTSGLEASNEQRAADLGASDFLLKPFDSEDTIRRVEALISGPGAAASADGSVTPLHQQLLAVLEAGWRLSIPEALLSGHAISEFTAEQIIGLATARVSRLARDRGIELHVQPVPSVAMRGDRDLIALAWSQIFEAAIGRAEPGSAVMISLGAAKDGVTLRVGLVCTAAAVARLQQLASTSGAVAPVRVERRRDAGVDIVVEVRASR